MTKTKKEEKRGDKEKKKTKGKWGISKHEQLSWSAHKIPTS